MRTHQFVANTVAKDHLVTSVCCAAAPQRNIGVVDDGVEEPLFYLPSADPPPADSLPSKGWRHDLEQRYRQAHRSL